MKDPFGGISTMLYDDYSLLAIESRDALPAPLTNIVRIRNNYRTIQPEQITDPNGNRAQVAFDALGMVAGTAVMGKETETKGDLLDGFNPDLTQPEIDAFLANPLGMAALLLGQATTRIIYDLEQFRTDGQPVVAATIARETHVRFASTTSPHDPGESKPFGTFYDHVCTDLERTGHPNRRSHDETQAHS